MAKRSSPPTRTEIDAQIAKLCKHEFLQGDKRSHLLQYLIRIQREGRYDAPFGAQKPVPTGKTILFEFYTYWAERTGGKAPTDADLTEPEGKQLVRQLAAALNKYYATVSDTLVIKIQTGRGKGYAPEIAWRSTPEPIVSTPLQVFQEPMARTEQSALNVMSKWHQGRFDDLLATVVRGPEGAKEDERGDLRLSTTFFVNEWGLRSKFMVALKKGVRIKILLMNPNNRTLLHGRFGLRADSYTPDVALPELRKQIGWLQALQKKVKESPEFKGTIRVRVSDIMPSGFVAHSRIWAVIGVMPTTESYAEGPMIEVYGPDTELWKTIDADWQARWRDAAAAEKLRKHG